jgi:hypothetical protein
MSHIVLNDHPYGDRRCTIGTIRLPRNRLWLGILGFSWHMAAALVPCALFPTIAPAMTAVTSVDANSQDVRTLLALPGSPSDKVCVGPQSIPCGWSGCALTYADAEDLYVRRSEKRILGVRPLLKTSVSLEPFVQRPRGTKIKWQLMYVKPCAIDYGLFRSERSFRSYVPLERLRGNMPQARSHHVPSPR